MNKDTVKNAFTDVKDWCYDHGDILNDAFYFSIGALGVVIGWHQGIAMGRQAEADKVKCFMAGLTYKR